MTGLPQGVTLGPMTNHPTTTARQVLRGGVALGKVWSEGPYTWRAGTGLGAIRTFANRPAAVRWLVLQARPVVYRVVPVLSPCMPWVAFAWQVYDSAGTYVAQTYDRVEAMTIARAEAQRVLRLTGVASG